MKIKFLFAALLFSAALSLNVFSQDMDAGISIMGKRDPSLLDDLSESKFTISNKLGFSGKDPVDGGQFTINTISAECDFHIYKSMRIIVNVPYGFSAGPLETLRGFGDMILMITADAPFAGNWNISVGGKFSSGSATLGDEPMAYQPGLGTNDLLIGFGKNFGIGNVYFGYQKPFDRSNNVFSEIRRGDDLMVRAGITQEFSRGFFQAEILGIKRIQKSNVLVRDPDHNAPKHYIDADQSDGFQLNALGRIGLHTSKYIRVDVLAALPLLTRYSDVDGLKRVFTIAASLSMFFKLD